MQAARGYNTTLKRLCSDCVVNNKIGTAAPKPASKLLFYSSQPSKILFDNLNIKEHSPNASPYRTALLKNLLVIFSLPPIKAIKNLKSRPFMKIMQLFVSASYKKQTRGYYAC